jgi:hypothetical protein
MPFGLRQRRDKLSEPLRPFDREKKDPKLPLRLIAIANLNKGVPEAGQAGDRRLKWCSAQRMRDKPKGQTCVASPHSAASGKTRQERPYLLL